MSQNTPDSAACAFLTDPIEDAQHLIDCQLFSAVSQQDLLAIDLLIAQGANPFAPVAPVEIYVARSSWFARIEKGCSAAQAIRNPDVLGRLLPPQMRSWPVITHTVDAFGLVSSEGSAVDLGHWAVEMSALESLKLIISRLDLSHPESKSCLERLTLSCLWGCSNTEAKDNVLNALVLCMASEPELGRGWTQWQNFKLFSHTSNFQSVLMPMTFVMASVANKKDLSWPYQGEALIALRWALSHDDEVREGVLRMDTGSKDSLMHMAMTFENLDVLRVALSAGCALDVRDALGMTPIEFASNANKFESVAFIQSWLANEAIEKAMANNTVQIGDLFQ